MNKRKTIKIYKKSFLIISKKDMSEITEEEYNKNETKGINLF